MVHEGVRGLRFDGSIGASLSSFEIDDLGKEEDVLAVLLYDVGRLQKIRTIMQTKSSGLMRYYSKVK